MSRRKNPTNDPINSDKSTMYCYIRDKLSIFAEYIPLGVGSFYEGDFVKSSDKRQ